MLIGIAPQNSIRLVNYAVIAEDELGMSRHDALVDACRKRAQPIIMTTLAMGASMMPIALGFAGDSSFRAPMAIAVIGGPDHLDAAEPDRDPGRVHGDRRPGRLAVAQVPPSRVASGRARRGMRSMGPGTDVPEPRGMAVRPGAPPATASAAAESGDPAFGVEVDVQPVLTEIHRHRIARTDHAMGTGAGVLPGLVEECLAAGLTDHRLHRFGVAGRDADRALGRRLAGRRFGFDRTAGAGVGIGDVGGGRLFLEALVMGGCAGGQCERGHQQGGQHGPGQRNAEAL
ncbi:efflux RND transporter permease subunit [Luteimonas sp. S4-F44]|uniref:efflux RND transporter permease subunit n=1 Tax=Luteimonas sp. S4-F44 TaxID=2925842 RepID=UPI001F537E74|nr:efflux RND transporter permease subunit [Luteimonas sp. S4-F44]UNK42609.1 efflux RND transporter permease subunit [Luteimonas sp. S4-F44]